MIALRAEIEVLALCFTVIKYGVTMPAEYDSTEAEI